MTRRSRYVDRTVIVLTAFVALSVLAVVVASASEAADGIGWRLVVMLLALAATVPLHLQLPTGLDASPVAPSIGLAMVLMGPPAATDDRLNTALIVGAVIIGLGAGLLLSRTLGQSATEPALVGGRILGLGVAAVLYRNVPFVDGQSAAAMAPTWSDSAWRTALAMTACGAVAITIDLTCTVLRVAPPGRLRETAIQHATETGPVWLAVLGVAVGMALGFGPLDLWSVPVMALPLLMMRTALRRQAAIVQVRRDAVAALAGLPERSGYTTPGHSRRVRLLARRIGQQLMLTEREMRDLENAALLHDVGQLGLTEPIPQGSTSDAAPADQLAIAAASAAVIREIASLNRVAAIIEQQPTPFRNVREFGEDVPVECRILKVCNAYDDLTQGHRKRHIAAMERIALGMGYEYDPDIVDLLSNLP